MKQLVIAAAAIMLVASIGGSLAAEHEIHMLNKGTNGAMVFEPDLVMAAPGDTIRFIPTDKTHSAETIPGMLPEGAEAFKGKVNEEVTITVDKEGVYGIKCQPHWGMGMVAVVVAGQPTNIEAAKAVKQPGFAKKRMDAIMAQIPAN